MASKAYLVVRAPPDKYFAKMLKGCGKPQSVIFDICKFFLFFLLNQIIHDSESNK